MNERSKFFFRNLSFFLIFLFLACEGSSDIYTLKVISVNDPITGASYYIKNDGDKVAFSQDDDPITFVAAFETDFENLDEIEVYAITDSVDALALHFIILKNGKMVKEERLGQTSTTDPMSRTFYYP